jgi:MFS family permease
MADDAAHDSRSSLVTLMVPRVAVVLNASMVNVAIPGMRSTFGVTSSEVAWVNTAYAISFVLFMPLFGSLGDRSGPRRLLSISLATLAGGSLLNALTDQFGLLLLGRFLQGVGGAGVTTLAIAGVVQSVPWERRGRALGAWNAVGPAAAVVGPVVAGVLTARFGWNAIFVLPLVVASYGMVMVLRRIPNAHGSQTKDAAPYPGTVNNGHRYPLFTWSFFGVALSAATRMFSNASLVFLAALYFADVHTLGAGTIGVILTSHAAGLGVTILLGGAWGDKRGTRAPVVWGMAVTAAAFAGLAAESSVSSIWAATAFVGLHGLAVGISLAPLDRGATLSVPAPQVANAVGVYNFIRFSAAAAAPVVSGVILQVCLETGMALGESYGVAFAVCAIVALVGACLAATLRPEEMSA